MRMKKYKDRVKHYSKSRHNDHFIDNTSNSKVLQKHHKPCNRCGTLNNLTEHHLKDKSGYRTGEIEILCRSCHNIAEKEYKEQGIGFIEKHKPIKIDSEMELQLQYMNGLLPFYSINPKLKDDK